jgi:hypothetical protein
MAGSGIHGACHHIRRQTSHLTLVQTCCQCNFCTTQARSATVARPRTVFQSHCDGRRGTVAWIALVLGTARAFPQSLLEHLPDVDLLFFAQLGIHW